MTNIIVKLLSVETGEIQEAVLTFPTNRGSTYQLSLNLAEGSSVEVEDRDYFECLRAIRLRLEPRGLKILVKGAQLNVWVTGMARQFNRGRIGFIMTPNQAAREQDEVDIFSPSRPDEIASVQAQQLYAREWFRCIARPASPEADQAFTENWDKSFALPNK